MRLYKKGVHCQMCAASDSALGKEKIKMKKEVVKDKEMKTQQILICLYNIA